MSKIPEFPYFAKHEREFISRGGRLEALSEYAKPYGQNNGHYNKGQKKKHVAMYVTHDELKMILKQREINELPTNSGN